MNRIIIAALAVALAGCSSVPSMGRAYPVTDVEAGLMDCAAIEREMSIMSANCERTSVLQPSCGAEVAAAIFVPFTANTLAEGREAAEARKSYTIRHVGLVKLWNERACGTLPVSQCPKLCGDMFFQTAAAGFCGDDCVTLSRKERKAYKELIEVSY